MVPREKVRSIQPGAADVRQKKPTTANRRRLEAAIAEALRYLPTVYKGSAAMPASSLRRFAVVGFF